MTHGQNQGGKVGYVFLMFIVSMLPHSESGRNDHQEGASHFTRDNNPYHYHFDFIKDLKIEFMKNEIAKYSIIGVGGLLFIIYINFEISFCFYKHLNLKSVYYYDIQHKCTFKGIYRQAEFREISNFHFPAKIVIFEGKT